MPRKKPKVDVATKIDVVCQKIVEGMVPKHILASVKKQFGSGISYYMFQKLRNGTYATGSGHAVELYRKKWAAKIATMPGNDYAQKRPVAPVAKAAVRADTGRDLHKRILRLVASEFNLNVDRIDAVNVTQGGCSVISQRPTRLA